LTPATAELHDVWKWYRHQRQPAVAGVSLAAMPGEIVGLVGRNAAGKTTLLRLLAGVLQPSAGNVQRDAGPGTPIRYFAGGRTLPPAVRASAWLRLWGRAGEAPDRPMGLLSHGVRQRLGLEAMLAGAADGLVLLDEPWEGLDPDASRWLSELLTANRESGAAIVVSSHRIHELATVCSRCVFVVAGRVASELPVGTTVPPGEPGACAERLLAAFDRASARAQA
jgi:ABC-2 type transport system ATP-binding protein